MIPTFMGRLDLPVTANLIQFLTKSRSRFNKQKSLLIMIFARFLF